MIPSESRDLREKQYCDSSNLRARAELHQRFRTNPYPWFGWVFDRITLPSRSRILELGCGPGALWSENLDRSRPGWEVFLSDFSWGMVREARAQLRSDARFHFAVADAEGIPFRNEAFDALVANHMLYHVPDLDQALSEIHRVLRPNGHLYAATNGAAHLRELGGLIQRFDPRLPAMDEVNRPFDLGTGREHLARWFVDVQVDRYEDVLVVTEAEPLVAYVFSMFGPYAPSPERRTEFAEFVGHRLASRPIRITKDVGMLVAARAAHRVDTSSARKDA